MAPLATVPDLEVRLGQTLDANRAAALLDDASAKIRSYTGRTFTQATSSVTVDICCNKATLPDGPVLSITSVTVDGQAVSYTRVGRKLTIIGGYLSAVVVYVHGYAEVPADIRAVVCQIAGRAYGANAQDSAVQTESLGSYAVGFGAAGAAGPLGMLNDERAVLDRYRSPAAPIRTTPWIVV
jgi:hypothetical protein